MTDARLVLPATFALGLLAGAPVGAQTNPGETETIDILVPVLTPEEQAKRDECARRAAERKDGDEILVCGEDLQSSEFFYSGNLEAAENRYARETMNRGNPQTPDPCGPQCGIFTGPPTVSGLCGFIFNPCPPPPALLIDIQALPAAPVGSDAQRVAEGLPPIDDEDAALEERKAYEQRILGLPAPTAEEGTTAGDTAETVVNPR